MTKKKPVRKLKMFAISLNSDLSDYIIYDAHDEEEALQQAYERKFAWEQEDLLDGNAHLYVAEIQFSQTKKYKVTKPEITFSWCKK